MGVLEATRGPRFSRSSSSILAPGREVCTEEPDLAIEPLAQSGAEDGARVKDDHRQAERSPNVRWQGSRLTCAQRRESLGLAGGTVWFTGLSGAGKSTIAAALEERLVLARCPAFLLDGDNLRHGLNGDLGFDEDARRENVRRTAHVAKLLAEAGTLALVSLISPYAQDRRAAAEMHADADLPFIEVFVDASLELCEQRDTKGLYARARAGEITGLTGLDAPYQAPLRPDVVLRSGSETVDGSVERVMRALTPRFEHAPTIVV
jgi:bifunctional enzyme CysN/CysC